MQQGQTRKYLIGAISATILGLGLAATPAMAQQPAQGQPPIASPAPDYSNAQLESFVNASRKIAMISQEYSPCLQAATDEASKRKVFEEADGKMVKAVHDEGMTVDQFNGINQALQQDPKLVNRVQELAK